ncbi:MAG: hypothetical protein HY960_11960 [Ignavibacteriae bacterium]|nr:hypothetical protein [Ignavibacteriota bacterium]
MKYFSLFFSMFFITMIGFGQIPRKLSYQGLLTDSSGVPLTNGNYDMTFKLYNLPAGGTLRFTESHIGVPVEQGTFSVTLGSVAPLTVTFKESLYVDVTVDNGPASLTYPVTFSSRTELTAAPYALGPWAPIDDKVYFYGKVGIGLSNPTSALEVEGTTTTEGFKMIDGASDGFIMQSDADGNASWVNANTISVSGDNLGNHTATQNINLNGNWLSNDGDNEGIYVDTSGNVGIGTTSTLSKFEVIKTSDEDNYAIVGKASPTSSVVKSSVGVTGFAQGYPPNSSLKGSPGTSVGVMGVANYSNSENAFGVYAALSTSLPDPKLVTTNSALYADGSGGSYSGLFVNGEVGIGTIAPTQTLEVVGTTKTTNFQMTNGASAGLVLQSDASGNASWVNPSTLTGSYLSLSGGTMTGAITSTGDPSITMGKGNFGTSNTNEGTQASVAGSNNHARGNFSVISGGGGAEADSNSATGEYTTIGGGRGNIASYDHATIGGGYFNQAKRYYTTIGGGYTNTISASYGTVGGGAQNLVSQQYGIIGGGGSNTASGFSSTISGGSSNTASGEYSTISGGESNTASGAYSFAAGRRAQALHDGSFVWADQTDEDFSSTSTNQFLIRATGGMRVYSPSGNADAKVESNSGHTYMSLSAVSGKEDALIFQTTSSGYKNRWGFGKSVASESGSNAGSDFFINRYDDAGSYLGQPFTIIRSTGFVGINTSSNKSTLDVNGSVGMRMKTNQIAGTNNPDETATTWIFTTGAGTINLPTASNCTNRMYVIINKTGATRTVSGYYDLSDTFQTSLATATALWVQSDGTNWLQVK